MNTHVIFGAGTLDKMVTAVERVRDRLRRSSQILEQAVIPYAIVGDNAVSAWIASVDESAVRFTQKVEQLVRRDDFERVQVAFAAAGLFHRCEAGLNLFLDDPTARDWHSARIVFAGERVRPVDLYAAPDVNESQQIGAMRVLSLGPLVEMQLSMFRTNECVNLRDLIDVELVGPAWLERLPPALAARLQELLDDPDG